MNSIRRTVRHLLGMPRRFETFVDSLDEREVLFVLDSVVAFAYSLVAVFLLVTVVEGVFYMITHKGGL